MFDKLFSGFSRIGEKKVRVKFKLLIKDINFQTNNYFMKNSTYSLFQVKNHKRKIKSKKNLFTVSDLKHIPLGGVIKFHATLYKSDGDRYSPKTRRLIIRQNNVVDCEDVYKDIGYVDLPLSAIVNGTQELDCKLQVSDSDKMLKAHINIAIRFKIKREGDKEDDDDDGVEGWEENEAEYTGKGSSNPPLKKQKSLKTVRMDLSESKVSGDIADDDSVDSRYVPPSSGLDEPLDLYVPEPTISSRGSVSGGGSVTRLGSVAEMGRAGSVVASVRGGDSVGSGSSPGLNSPVRLAPSGSSVEFRQPITEEWQVEQQRQLSLLQQRQPPQQFGRHGSTYDLSPSPVPIPPVASQSFYVPSPAPMQPSQSFYAPVHSPPPAAAQQSFYVAAQNQQAQLEQSYSSQHGRSMHNMHQTRDPYNTQSSNGSVHSNHSNESPSHYPPIPPHYVPPRVSQPVSPAYTSPFQSQQLALQQVQQQTQHQAQTDYVNNSRRSQYGQFDAGIASQPPSQYVAPAAASSSNTSIFQQQLQQQQQYEQQRQQSQLQRQPAYRGTSAYNQQYSPPSPAADNFSYDRQSSYEQQQEPYGNQYGGSSSSGYDQQQQSSPPSQYGGGGGYDDQQYGNQSPYGFPQQYASQYSNNNSRQSSATNSSNSRQSSGVQQHPSPPNSSRGGGGGDYLVQLNRSNSSSNMGNRVRFDDNSLSGMSRGSGGGGSHYSQQQQGMY